MDFSKTWASVALALVVLFSGIAFAGADATPPVVGLTLDGGALYNSTGTVSAVVSADDPESGIAYCEIDWTDGSDPEEVSAGVVNHVYADGHYPVSLVCFNGEGLSDSATAEITVDTIAPIGTDILFVNGPTSDSLDVSVSFTRGTDDGAGIAFCEVDWTDGSAIEEIPLDGVVIHSFPIQGVYNPVFVCFDNAGNYSSDSETVEIILDANPPVGQSIVLDEGAEYNTTGLVTAALNPGTDDTEILYCQVSTDDGDSWTNTASDDTEFGAILPDGMQSFLYRCVDVFDNVSEIVSDSIVVDTTAPQSWASVDGDPFYSNENPFVVEAYAFDNTTEVTDLQLFYRFNGGEWVNSGLEAEPYVPRSGPTHMFTFTAEDGDGVYEFYTIATDTVGHVEEPPSVELGEDPTISPDAVVVLDTVAPVVSVSPQVLLVDTDETVNFDNFADVNEENPYNANWDYNDGASCEELRGGPYHSYCEPGVYHPMVEVTDAAGNATVAGLTIVVGNYPFVPEGAEDVVLEFINLPPGQFELEVTQSDSSPNGTSGFQVGGQFFEITSTLTNGDFNVTLTFNYADADNDGVVDGTSINENELNVHYWNGSAWELVPNPVRDTANNTISVNVDHFTNFGLLGPVPPAPQPPQGGGGGGSLGGGTFYTPTGGATATTTTPADETTQAIDSPVPAPVNRSPYVVSTTPAPAPVPVAPPAIVPAPASGSQAAPTPTAPTGFFGLGATNGNIVLVVLVVLGLFSFQRFYSLKMKKTQ